MTPFLPSSHVVHHPVSPSKPAQAIQLVQGAYYALGGLLVAAAATSFVGPEDPAWRGSMMWPVRAVALAVAGFGAAMILSGRRDGGGFVPAGAGMWAALGLCAVETGAIAMGALPRSFLLDAGLEFLFAAWWVVEMLGRVGHSLDGVPPPAGSARPDARA